MWRMSREEIHIQKEDRTNQTKYSAVALQVRVAATIDREARSRRQAAFNPGTGAGRVWQNHAGQRMGAYLPLPVAVDELARGR